MDKLEVLAANRYKSAEELARRNLERLQVLQTIWDETLNRASSGEREKVCALSNIAKSRLLSARLLERYQKGKAFLGFLLDDSEVSSFKLSPHTIRKNYLHLLKTP